MFTGSILAIDAATKSGIADGSPGEIPRLETISFARPDDAHPDIFARAIRFINHRIETQRPALIVIEGIIQVHDKTIQAGLWAIFVGTARNAGIPILEAPIATWRAWALGNGHLSKIDAKARAVAACERLRWQAPDHNAAEAGMIWAWAVSKVAQKHTPHLEPLFLAGGAHG